MARDELGRGTRTSLALGSPSMVWTFSLKEQSHRSILTEGFFFFIEDLKQALSWYFLTFFLSPHPLPLLFLLPLLSLAPSLLPLPSFFLPSILPQAALDIAGWSGLYLKDIGTIYDLSMLRLEEKELEMPEPCWQKTDRIPEIILIRETVTPMCGQESSLKRGLRFCCLNETPGSAESASPGSRRLDK